LACVPGAGDGGGAERSLLGRGGDGHSLLYPEAGGQDTKETVSLKKTMIIVALDHLLRMSILAGAASVLFTGLMPNFPRERERFWAKNLGRLDTWEDKLKVAKESGYNMIHFTPVQVIGASKSAYSLEDQHNLNVGFETDWSSVAAFVTKMEKEWGVLSLCDIVLNHTSNETKW